MSKTGLITKIGRLTIRPHIRSNQTTGRWQVDIPSDTSQTGKRTRKMAGSYDDAVALAKSLQHRRPIPQTNSQSVCTQGQTLSEVLGAWFEKQQIRINLGKKKALSVQKDLTYLKALQKFFGNTPINAINEDSLEGYQQLRKTQSIKPITIDCEIRTLKAVLNFCVKKRWLSQCPTVEPLRVPKQYTPLPTTEEVRAVLDELSVHHRILCLSYDGNRVST